MEPNYRRAARKAAETMARFGASVPVRILPILHQLPDVSVIALDVPSIPGHESWDAFSCVREKCGVLQHIVIYNKSLTPSRLNLALARELAHIILKHGPDVPEEIWSAEADCFAYHCVCYQPFTRRKKTIQFCPKLDNTLWEMKSIQSFESLDHMIAHIADEQTRYARAIRGSGQYTPDDVELRNPRETDLRTGWKNCYDIVLAGKTVGYCGE